MDLTSAPKINKGLIVDVVFYISISLLISAVLCYFIFSIKISNQKKAISKIDIDMLSIGTDLQKQKESAIFNFRKKIDDYSGLLQNHRSTVNILNILDQNTMPEVWFNRFSMSEKDKSVVLSGEADSMEVLSQQMKVLESNQYVSKINVLSSSIGDSGRVVFNLSMVLDSKIFIPMQPVIPDTANIQNSVSNNIIGTTTP